MQISILVIFKIAISFTVLFVLPFILVTARIFHQEDKLFQIYVSMIIGLFISTALVYLLAAFGLFNKTNFLLSYGSLILIANIYFLRQVKHWRINFKLKLTGGFVLLLFAFAIGIYMRTYDPLKHISLGSGDFYVHLQFIKETAGGHIFSSYPRGYHIVLALVNFILNIDFYALARFAGAVFGIISIGAVYCLMRQVFGKKAAVFATLFYSGLSFLNYLTIEEIGLFAQGFGFVLIPFAVYFALGLVNDFKEGALQRRNILLFVFIVFLLGLISPYAMLETSYFLYILLFFSIILHSSIRKHIRRFFKNVTVLIILFSLGMLIVLSYYTFLREFRQLGIRLPTYEESKVVRLIEEGESEWKAMEESATLADWTTNKWEIAKNLLRVKGLRVPVEFPLSIGVYVGLLLSLFIVVFSIRKKRVELFAISAFTLFFGVSCITGILEFPLYQGRAGWYFMLGAVWLGGIIAKRFYDQELMRDVLHTFKKVIPLPITNKAKSINKSKASLLYVILTLSGLASYLVVVWVFGLLRANPIRDVSLLLFVLIAIFLVGRKKRDVISGERVSSRFPENARLSLSLHKILVLTAVLVVMLYPMPKPPEYNFRYYHRSINEDDFIKVVQEIKDRYPLSEAKLFLDDDIVRGAAGKTKNIMYPQNIEMVATQDILSGMGDKRYSFLFLDYEKEESDSFKNMREWVSIYEEEHNPVRVFYNSENIVVYLIENYDVSPNQN